MSKGQVILGTQAIVTIEDLWDPTEARDAAQNEHSTVRVGIVLLKAWPGARLGSLDIGKGKSFSG